MLTVNVPLEGNVTVDDFLGPVLDVGVVDQHLLEGVGLFECVSVELAKKIEELQESQKGARAMKKECEDWVAGEGMKVRIHRQMMMEDSQIVAKGDEMDRTGGKSEGKDLKENKAKGQGKGQTRIKVGLTIILTEEELTERYWKEEEEYTFK